MAFRARWRELTKLGWTSKRPSGLSDDHTYLKPGKTKRDVENEDFFVGAEALMEYLGRCDREEMEKEQSKASSQDPKETAGVRTVDDGTRRASASDAPPLGEDAVEVSSDLTGASSTSNSGRSIQVERGRDEGSFNTDAEEQQVRTPGPSRQTNEPLIATSPHVGSDDGHASHSSTPSRLVGSPDISSPRRNLTEAFEAESASGSEYQFSGSENDSISPDGDEETKEDLGAVVSAAVDDPNKMMPGDNPNDYAALDSDSDNDAGSVYDDDEDIGPVEGSAEDSPTVPDLHFEPSLLSAVGGVDEIARGNLRTDVLTDIKFNGWSVPRKEEPYPYMQEPFDARPVGWMKEDYPGIYDGEGGPTAEALVAATCPSGAFFRFAPPQLWETIAGASDDYFEENIDARVATQHAKQQARQRKRPEFQVQTPEQIKAYLQKQPDISGRELCVFIGLLIAHTIAPNKEKFENHWKTSDEGAIPRGCFNPFMKRDRFAHISRNLHFSSNSDKRAATDRAWKLRPVIDVLQETFKDNFIPPPVMAFDEAMLPSRSTFNKMRVFMKDKPHRWGTKLFMLCCSQSAYCIRFEVYCGKKQMQDDSTPKDEKSGPAAVVRNLRQVFGSSGPRDFRLIVTDRFYTSVVLAMQLLTMKFYTVGTIMMNRQGLCEAILPPKLKNGRRASNKRPRNIERGTYEVAQSRHVPMMKALRWYDNQGVHILATGGSGARDRIVRRTQQTGEETELMAPRIVKDYQTYMGGVDVHDQLRLQRYSLQLARRYKKYYKSLFLGLIDMVIVNACIVYNWQRSIAGKPKSSHIEFLKQLYLELIQLRTEDWEEMLRHRGLNPTSTKRHQTTTAHVPIQTDEWCKGNKTPENVGTRKRRQRACKVCSVLKRADQSRGGETTFYCGGCKLKTASKNAQAARVFLCNKVKHTSLGVAVSCFEIWHKHMKNGTLIPQTRTKRKIRARKPAQEGESGNGSGEASNVEDESDAFGNESGSDGRQQTKRARADAE